MSGDFMIQQKCDYYYILFVKNMVFFNYLMNKIMLTVNITLFLFNNKNRKLMKKITLADFSRSILGFTAASFLLGGFQMYAQPYMNSNISTGTVTKNGVIAPIGYTWSETQSEPGATVSNTTTGVGTQIIDGGGNRVADDFTVPAGQTWNLTKATFYAYQTGYEGIFSPFTDVRVRIHNSIPSGGTSAVVFGDLTTNRLLASMDAMMYRVPNTTTPAPGTAPLLNRKVFKIEANVNVSLPAGTYWIEWQHFAGANGNFSPPSTVVDVRTVAGYNAIQWVGVESTWKPIIDTGNPATAADVALDMPFLLDYTLESMGVSEKGFAAGISVFPNPVKNMLNITSETILDNAEIFDVTGRLVKSVKFNGLLTNSVNVNSLSGGNYIVKLTSGENVVARKFIKQ